jgi:hypothetical protein
LPVWSRIRRFIERPATREGVGPARVVGALDGDAGGGAGGLRSLSDAEFKLLAGQFPYYGQRAGYMRAARGIASELIAREGLRTALELGPHVRSMVVGGDIMDRRPNPELEFDGAVIVHDATSVPWPFADGAYDLFVALQVFEHLKGQQQEAFAEVRRICRNAIISVPIGWKMDDPRNCHHRISKQMALSWFAPTVPTRIVVGNRGSRTRLIFVFEGFDRTRDPARLDA